MIVVAVVATVLMAIARLLMAVEVRPSFDDEPAWWPEFEREFADHVASRD